jgi:hypothetical protein
LEVCPATTKQGADTIISGINSLSVSPVTVLYKSTAFKKYIPHWWR